MKTTPDIPEITVGILSDTHGRLDERIRTIMNDCDHIVHAGDICGAAVLDALKPKRMLHAVAGNNDYAGAWDATETDVVNALPKQIKLQLPGGLLLVEHGHRLGNYPEHDRFRQDHADAKLVVYGHTHKRVIDQTTEPWIVNPGAAGETRTKGGPSCLILTASEDRWQIEEKVFPYEIAAS